ncbi:uncharacterized protein BJ171DRAFT_492910 [Polychytrium aggregatum]|uniref:uncharacterized protein n=1 Tax=Polychytrium aggregatum TaxID=110093 RepID=UPI0022FE84AA|nr:uncharacterized protein BJ171DRAFT_492910 [Polychytrium aggregatum]KAI9207502.1 hypothetical protein BJ171DRAFT_492910 [Polychytrium aggregatum]
MAEIRVLEVIEESRVQLEQLDHYRGVTIAQQETVALSQLMLDRQRRHEMDLKLAQLDRERQEEQHRSRRVPSPPQGHDHEYSSASFEDISSLGSSEGSSDTATPDLDRYKVAPGRSPDPRLDAVDADIAEEIGQDTAQDESVVYIEPVSEAVIEDESSAPEMMEVDEHQAADDQRTRLHHDTTSLSASGNLAMELKRRELVLEERLKAELHAIQLDRQRHATDPRHDDLGHSLEHALYMQYAAEKAEIALKWNAALREERQEKSAIATAEQLTAQHASAPESVLEPITSGVDVAEPSERTQPAECVKGPVADFGITPVDEAINLIATLNKQGHDFRVPIPPPLSMPGTEFSKQTSHGSSALPADAAQSPLPGSPIQSADAGALSYRPEESFMSIEEDVPLDLGSVEIDAERVSAQTAQSLMSTEEPVVSVTETSFQAGRSAPPPAIAAFGRESDSDSSLLRGKIELARQTVQSDAIERKKAKLAESRKLAEGLLEERLNQDRQRRELKRETKEISRLLDKILSPAPLHQGTESRSVSAEVPGAAAHSIQAPAEGFAIASLQGQLTASKYTPVVARADTAVKPIPTSGSVSQDHHRHASIPESIDFVSDAAESLGSIAESVVVESEIATPVALQPSEQPVHIQHDPTAVTLSAIQPPDQSTAPEVATDEIIEEQSAQPISSVASSGVPLSARDSARFGASLLEAPVGGMASDGRPAEIVSQVQHPDLQYTSIVADTEPQYPTDFEDFEKSAAAEEQEDSLSLEDLEIKTRILALQKEVLLKRKQADELLQKKQLQRTLAKQKMYEAELKLKSELSLLDHFIEKTSTEIDHLGGPSKSIDQLPPFDINDVKRTGKAKSSVSPGPNVPQVGSASQTPASHSTHPIDAEPRAMSPRVPDTLPASEYAAKTSPPPEESLIEEHISQANSVDMSAADSISSFHVDVREPIIPDDRADAVSRTAADAPGADVDMNEVEESIVSTPATDNSQVDRMSLEQPVPTTIEHAAKALAIGSAAPVDGSMDLSMPEEHAEVSVAYSDDAFESLDLRPDDSEQAYQASQTPTNIPNHQPVEQPSVDRLRKSKTPHDPQQPETSTVLVSEVSEDIQEDIVPEEPRCESQDDIALEGSGHLELQAAQNVAEISSEMAQDAVRRRDSDAVSQPASQSSLKDAALSDNDAAAGSHPPITAKVEALPSSHVPMDEYPELFETDHISEEIEGRSEGAIAEQALTIDQPLEPATGTSQLASAPASNEPEPHLRAGDLDADTVDEVQSAPIDSQMLSSCDQRAAEPAHGKEAEDMDHAMGQEAEDQRLDTFSQPLIRDTPADSPTEKSLFSDQDLAPVPLGSELESVIPMSPICQHHLRTLSTTTLKKSFRKSLSTAALSSRTSTNRKVVSSELTSEARYISGLSTESLISIREHLAIPTEELDQAPGKELAQVLTEAASNVWPDMPSEAIAEKPAGGLPAESQGVALSKPETRPGVNSTNRLGSKAQWHCNHADHRNEQMAEHICDVIFEPLLDGSVEAMLKLRHHVAATGNVARDNSAAEQQLALDARPEQPQSQAQYNESVVDIITDMILADILKDPALDALSKNQDAPAAETATVQGQSAPPTEYIQTETQPIESEGEQPVALPEAIVLKPTVEAHTTIVEPRPPSEPTEAASLTPEYALGVVDLILKEYEAHKASVSKQQGVTPALHSTYISRRFMRTLSQSTPFRNPIFNQLVVDAFNQATKEMAPFTNQSISQLLICHKTAVTASTSTDIQNVKSIIVDWMLYSKEYGENLDALLIKEVKVQERRWLNTDLMAPLVKEQCAESIWQRLLEDTVACVRRTTQAKW